MRISDWSSDVCSSYRRTASRLRRRQPAARSPPVGAARRVRGWTETKSCCGNLLRLRSVGQGNIEARARDCHLTRSDERRVGNECVSTCRYRRSTSHQKKIQSDESDNEHKSLHM